MRKTALPIAAVLLALLVQSTAIGATSYHGSISAPSDLIVTGFWQSGTVEWWIDLDSSGSYWHYKYAVTVAPKKDVSHFMVEVSPGFGSSQLDVFNATVNGSPADAWTDTYSQDSHGGSDPTIPGPLYGVKFESDSYGLTNIIEFDSRRNPVWGDMYVVDGKNTVPATSAWNEGFKDYEPLTAGFQDWDPDVPAANGSLYNHILSPDSQTPGNIIPEWNSLLLAAIGLIPAARLRRGKRA